MKKTRKTKELVWSTELLDDGSRKTQEMWVKWLEENGNGFRLPTVEDYESLADWPDSDFKSKLKQDMIHYWLTTADKIINPFTGEERPVVLGVVVDDSRFNILAGDGIGDGPARGVREK